MCCYNTILDTPLPSAGPSLLLSLLLTATTGGPDVYSGVKIDYRGADVTAETFLAVLEGDSSSVTNKGTGRVIESGPNDRVFLFYSDHGAAGVVGMPSGPFLYADELMKTLRKKFHRRGFKEMVM